MIVDNSRTGLDWKGLAVIAAMTLGGAGVGAYAISAMANKGIQPAALPANPDDDSTRVRVYWGEKEIKPGQSEQATIR